MSHARVDSLHQLGRYAEAEQLARDGLATDPNDAFMQVLLARAILRQDRLGPAADAINRAIALDPDLAYGYRIKGMIHGATGFTAEADKAYARSLALDPDDPFTYVQRAYLDIAVVESKPTVVQKLRQKSRFAPDLRRATRDLDHALWLAPEQPQVHLGLAALHATYGRNREAEAAARRALQLDPQNAGAHETLGMLAERRRDLRAASDHYVAAGRADPTASSPLARLKKLGAPALAVPSIALYVGLRFATKLAQVNTTMLIVTVVAVSLGLIGTVSYWQYSRRSARRQFTSQAQQVIEGERSSRRRRFGR